MNFKRKEKPTVAGQTLNAPRMFRLMFNSMLPEDIEAEELYRVAGEFRRRKLEIKLNYGDDIINLLTAGDETGLSLRIAGSPQLLEAQMTYEHEMTHWYQQIGTAYGHLQLEIDDCSARNLDGFFNHFRALHPKAAFPHPLESWAFRQWPRRRAALRLHLERGGTFETYMRGIAKDPLSFVLLPMLMNRVIELCEGADNSSELITDFLFEGGLWRGLSANVSSIDSAIVEGLELRQMRMQRSDSDAYKSSRAAVPVVSGYGPIGAWHVMEGQAYWLELSKVSTLSHQRRVSDSIESYVASSGPRDYRVAFEHFLPYAEASSLSPTDLVITFCCICDLALATPMHIVFYEIASDLSWRDVHPGWRFFKLCEAIRDVGAVRAETSSLGVDAYMDFMERICRQLSWPTPVQMAQHFLNQGAMRLSATLGNYFFAAASAQRIENPTAFALYLFDDPDRARPLIESLPVPLITFGEGDDERFRLPYWGEMDENKRLSMARDFLIARDAYRLTDFLLYSNSEISAWNGFMTGHADEVLRQDFGISQDEFAPVNKSRRTTAG